MQNLIFLMNPPSNNWNTSSKAAQMCLNRLCIDEDAAFELSGVYYFEESFMQTFYDYFYDVRTERFDQNNIHSTFREIKINEAKERKIHFVCTVYWGLNDELRSFILEGMKKFKLESVMVTNLYMERRNLITKEKMESHYNGEETSDGRIAGNPYEDLTDGETLKESVNDDLDSFFEDLRLGKEPEERVSTFFLPKLTQEELELMKRKDDNYETTFNFPHIYWRDADVKDAEMKLSESDSKFVRALAHRKTIIIENSSQD